MTMELEKIENERRTFKAGTVVMWDTANSSGTGIVINDCSGEYVLVGVLPKTPAGMPKANRDVLMEGPFSMLMCVATSLFAK